MSVLLVFTSEGDEDLFELEELAPSDDSDRSVELSSTNGSVLIEDDRTAFCWPG